MSFLSILEQNNGVLKSFDCNYIDKYLISFPNTVILQVIEIQSQDINISW